MGTSIACLAASTQGGRRAGGQASRHGGGDGGRGGALCIAYERRGPTQRAAIEHGAGLGPNPVHQPTQPSLLLFHPTRRPARPLSRCRLLGRPLQLGGMGAGCWLLVADC